MIFKANTIYTRLFVPFSVMLVIATVIAWWLTTSVFTSVLETRLAAQLKHAASILSRGELPYTQPLLERLGNLLKADIVLVREKNHVELSTLEISSPLTKQILALLPNLSHEQTDAAMTFTTAEAPYTLVYMPVSQTNRENLTAVIAIAKLDDVSRASQQVTGWLAIAALIGVLVFAIIGHRTALKITQPIQDLVQMATEISAGNRSARTIPQGSIELVDLAKHLNHMAATLEKYENDVADNSRLATIGQMAARIAHEIRNPLTAIKIQIQLLSESLAGQKQEIAIKLLSEIRRLESIVTSTLGMSQITTLNKTDTDINNLINEVTDLFTAQFQHLNIELVTEFAHSIPTINLDPARIKQVLVNLIINASEALQRNGTILITTRLSRVENLVEIIVDDSGPGIQHFTGQDVFAHNKSQKDTGFGLGLKICKELVELHGGKISANPSPLGGARFIIELTLTETSYG